MFFSQEPFFRHCCSRFGVGVGWGWLGMVGDSWLEKIFFWFAGLVWFGLVGLGRLGIWFARLRLLSLTQGIEKTLNYFW